MFIPVEPVFIEVLKREPSLFQEAWNKRVMDTMAFTRNRGSLGVKQATAGDVQDRIAP